MSSKGHPIRMSAAATMTSDFVFSANSDTNMIHNKKPPDKQQPTNPKPSFCEKLLGSFQEIPSHPKEDMIKNKLVRIEHENGNRLLPKVS